MTDKVCEDISEEKLVAFADGQLSPGEAAQVSEHITQCESCAGMVDALQQSIKLVTASWAAEQAKWSKWRLPEKPRLSRRPMVQVVAVAASILLVLGVGSIWRMVSEPSKPMPTKKAIAQLQQTVMRAGTVAQMLAVADLLAKQPEGRDYARKRYTEIARNYSGTECAEQAKLRLKTL